MTHGCSIFALTKRNLTPLDIVTAHSIVPGREDVALLLGEAMRSEGWEGGKMDQRRRIVEQQQKRRGKQKELREDVAKVLGVHPNWWGQEPEFPASDDDTDDDSDDPNSDAIYVSWSTLFYQRNVHLILKPKDTTTRLFLHACFLSGFITSVT